MKKKVLVIDNDQLTCELMEEVFTYYDYDVKTTGGIKDIILLLEEVRPDLVIIDFLLDGITGGDLCITIKNNNFFRNLPIIIFSAYPNLVHALKVCNYDLLIEKPFDMDYLMQKVKYLLLRQVYGLRINTNIKGY